MPIDRHTRLPLREVTLRTSRSSGPGGQHANVTASRVEAVFRVADSKTLTDEQKRRITARYGPVVVAVAQDARSQARNRELALERLSERGIVDLDEERKAAMVSNLMVVLCGDQPASPVVNTGTLYS